LHFKRRLKALARLFPVSASHIIVAFQEKIERESGATILLSTGRTLHFKRRLKGKKGEGIIKINNSVAFQEKIEREG